MGYRKCRVGPYTDDRKQCRVGPYTDERKQCRVGTVPSAVAPGNLGAERVGGL